MAHLASSAGLGEARVDRRAARVTIPRRADGPRPAPLTDWPRLSVAVRAGRSVATLLVTVGLVLLTLAGASVLPPGRSVHAESILGSAISVGTNPFDVAADPVNSRVYVAQGDSITVIDGRTNQRIDPPIAVAAGVNGIAFNPTNQRIYVSNTSTTTVTVIDASNRSIIGAIPVGNNPTGLAVDPTTNRVYVGAFGDSSIRVIDGNSTANGGAGDTIGNPIGVGGPADTRGR